MLGCVFLSAFVLWTTVASKALPSESRLLLISFDGFRYDYIEEYKPKNFLYLVANGVYGPAGMIPVFPTKTFPNHYSLVTGLYPESHGVVDNNMYDPVFNETFELNVDTDTKWFDQAEPIWITARLQGLITGALCWPGSSTKISGTEANFYTEFNESLPFEDRVKEAISWFTQKASFVALYFEEPDSTGHKYGVLSDKIREMVSNVDRILGQIIDQLKHNNIFDTTNIIIISDHGMLNTSRKIEENLILDNILDPSDYFIIPQTGPVASILPKEGKLKTVYDKLKGANDHVKVYYKEELPLRFHYKNNRRIMPIVAIAEESYQIMKNEGSFKNSSFGQHGYDNMLQSMQPVFLATGPAFKTGVTIEPFQNFYIYSLMCHLLGIQPKPNNGTVDVFTMILKSKSSSSFSWTLNYTGNTMILILIFDFLTSKYIL